MTQLQYYRLSRASPKRIRIDEDWLELRGWKQNWRGCGVRLPGVSKLELVLATKHLPFQIGFFGYPNISFIDLELVALLEPEFTQKFTLGPVFDCEGLELPTVRTFMSPHPQVQVRSTRPFDRTPCDRCGRLTPPAWPPEDQHIVSRRPLTDGLFEGSTCDLIVREDLLDRIRPALKPHVKAQHLPIIAHGLDGRDEPELEW